jgi:PBP1b-binding outer membrane lipoprotein LpoB
MKKLLTLVVLVAGVALFAGCLNKPAVEDETTTPTVEETTTPTVEEVTPAVDEVTGTVETAPTEEVAPTPTAE